MRIALPILSYCWLAVTVFGGTPDYFEPKLLSGSIYDKPAGRLLFTFRRTATQTGDVIRVLREFRAPDGSLVAQERVVYERGRLVRFELDESQINASGHARIDPQQINFEYTAGPAAKRKRKLETIREAVLISDMLPAFVANHWDDLQRGAVVKFRYLVVPRLETIAFKLTRQVVADLHGKKVVQIKMEPANWIIAQVLDPLLFTVEAEPPHRILQYWGRTTPKIRTGQTWHDLDALTVFNW